MTHALVLALCSNICFATASYYFGIYSRKTSSEWMNYYKATVAVVGFFVMCLVLGAFRDIAGHATLLLVGSGLLGLMIGDIFLLRAFEHLGSGRTLMVFGFQPLLLGFASIFLFNQDFPPARFVAVLFLIGCLYSFALESAKTRGHWELKGLLYAMIGVGLDAAGLLLTRQAFDESPGVSPFFVNFIRALAAVVGFAIWSRATGRFTLLEPLKSLPVKERWFVTGVCALGTFLSLSFYLHAIQIGHLATITAIACTGPLFATLFETLLGQRPFNRYLAAGIVFFLCGFALLVQPI